MIANISEQATVSESENATIEKWQNKVREAHLKFSSRTISTTIPNCLHRQWHHWKNHNCDMPRRTLNRKNIYDLNTQKCQMPSINLFIDTFGHRLLYDFSLFLSLSLSCYRIFVPASSLSHYLCAQFLWIVPRIFVHRVQERQFKKINKYKCSLT